MNPYVLYASSVAISSLSQILLKKSALKKHDSLVREYVNPYVIIAYGMFFGAVLLAIYALRSMEYKNGPLIESLGFILVLFLSRIFFGEKLTRRKIVGTLCVLVGMVVFYL
ncbi:MAG: EamA family transporter [Lachnospiraceae bacterium]|nr:EamA family transporter [Lachnospiraceae bacterium]